VAALAATVFALGGALGESPGAASAPDPPLGGIDATAATKTLVKSLEARVRAHPRDSRALTLLGLAYEQRERETGNPIYVARADRLVRRAVRLAPRNAVAVSALASLALGRHQFRPALRLGRRALRLDRRNGAAYAIVGDALLELGRYDEAFRIFDGLAARKPGVAAYARISYGRELLGDTRGALEAMKLAESAAGGRAEPTAWTSVQLGKLEFSRGRPDLAERHFRLALAVFPSYAHAFEGLARVEAARGHTRRALALARRAASQAPLPQFAATLGDLYALAGNDARAREQYERVHRIERDLQAGGLRNELEVALFDVDHGVRLRRAVTLARRARAARPSVDSDDALGWALARAGRCGEALHFSERALRLGTRDASKWFHRGMIERCLGHERAARAWFRRALARNPYFSLRWAAVAREYGR